MKAAVIVFPGSNCDRDIAVALEQTTGKKPDMVWHGDSNLKTYDLIAVPGGFSYGDYLRCGAMAAHSPIMREVKNHADAGRHVIGICNGFQVLTEVGLLPGVLMRNKFLKFICKPVDLEISNKNTAFTTEYANDNISIPVAHHDGNYYCDDQTLEQLEANEQIVFRYRDNPNGSRANIAGIINRQGNVLGMMPHPERHADPLTGGEDGKALFTSLMKALH
jgi:phosphoribosylformylglycinamidine synthase